MKASKFSEAQKAFIVKQGEEGAPVAEISYSNSGFIARSLSSRAFSSLVKGPLT